mgnify:CR=1 FL=1
MIITRNDVRDIKTLVDLLSYNRNINIYFNNNEMNAISNLRHLTENEDLNNDSMITIPTQKITESLKERYISELGRPLVEYSVNFGSKRWYSIEDNNIIPKEYINKEFINDFDKFFNSKVK